MSVGRKLTSVLLKQSVNVQCQRWFSAAVRLDDDEVYKRSKTAKTFLVSKILSKKLLTLITYTVIVSKI